MKIGFLRKYSKIKKFLLSLVKKEFLIFMFFLFLSGSFWLVMTLNETYEKEITIGVNIINVPKSLIITNDVPATIRITVRDKGYMIGGYLYGDVLKPLNIDFRNYADGKGHGTISYADLQKMIYQQLYNSSKITSMKPDKVEFFYNFGKSKKVPVRLSGTISPQNGYYLAETRFSPDSVTVYAAKELLDSIHNAYTSRFFVSNFGDTLTKTIELRKVKGAKFVPASVSMKLIPDILTEETVEVPIEAINTPPDKLVRTFPSKVKVKFVVGAARLSQMPKNAETKQLLPQGFRVVVDYNQLVANPTEKCRISVFSTPKGIRNAKPDISEVDYLIEQQ
jgi:hypothetical protein